jgi:excisionase family DNA binding protein
MTPVNGDAPGQGSATQTGSLASPTQASVAQAEVGRSPFLTVEEVAPRLRCSQRTVRELTRLNEIPHLKRPGARRVLFRPDWLEAWELGAELETVALPRGGRVVRPVAEEGRR